jgi:hypothetical protein
LAVAGGESKLARGLLDRSRSTAVAPYHVTKIHTAEAVLSEADGDTEAAWGSYMKVADEWASFGCLPERANALFGTGRCLLRLQRMVEARGFLTDALTIYAKLGAAPAIAETESLLRSSSAAG